MASCDLTTSQSTVSRPKVNAKQKSRPARRANRRALPMSSCCIVPARSPRHSLICLLIRGEPWVPTPQGNKTPELRFSAKVEPSAHVQQSMCLMRIRRPCAWKGLVYARMSFCTLREILTWILSGSRLALFRHAWLVDLNDAVCRWSLYPRHRILGNDLPFDRLSGTAIQSQQKVRKEIDVVH